MREIATTDWRWHIGLDRVSSQALDALYRGAPPSDAERERFLMFFELRFADALQVGDELRGHPVTLALAMDETRQVRLKPQNLLLNLPMETVN